MSGHTRRARSKTAAARARTVWAPNESDELLRLAVQVGGIGIYETDFEQDRTRFSPELCIILGLPAGTEMSYAEASRLFHERDRAIVTASVEAARTSADEGKWSGVHQILRADGEVRWVSIHGRRHYRDTAKGRQAKQMGLLGIDDGFASSGIGLERPHLRCLQGEPTSELALMQRGLRLFQVRDVDDGADRAHGLSTFSRVAIVPPPVNGHPPDRPVGPQDLMHPTPFSFVGLGASRFHASGHDRSVALMK